MVSVGHGGAKSVLTQIVAPVLVDQSAANVLSAAVDMVGYDRVRFIFNLGAVVATGTLDAWAVESHESNLGNSVNIAGEIAGVAAQQAKLAQVPQTQNNNVFVLDIVRPTRRYAGVVIDAGTANITSLSVIAERFRGTGAVPPTDPAKQYVTVRAN